MGSGWASRDPGAQPFLLNCLLRDNCLMEKARGTHGPQGVPLRLVGGRGELQL